MQTPKIYQVVKILSIIGIIIAVYLLYAQISQTSFRPCTINETINCDAVISGPVSKTLGIPTPLYGLIGYIVIFFAAKFKKNLLILSMSAFGLVFCLYIAYVEIFRLGVICPLCIGCQIIMILIFSIALYLNRQKFLKLLKNTSFLR